MDNTKVQQMAIRFANSSLMGFCLAYDRQYTVNWHHRKIAEKLKAVERGDIKRLMIFMPPRHGKSQLSSVYFPAWYLGRNPDKEIITASYSSDLAREFGAKTRDVVNDNQYKAIFNTRLREDSRSKDKWVTEEGGSYVSVGIGGSLTGRGADVLLIDDPIKNREEAQSEVYRNKVWNWFTSTAYTRLEPDGAIILIMTRWHNDDLAGRLLDGDEKWEVVEFPAIATKDEEFRKMGDPLWPERYSLEELRKTKSMIGVMDWAALYQQRPIMAENAEFKREYFKYFDDIDLKGKDLKVYVTVDLAISKSQQADNTSIQVVGKELNNPNWYHLEDITERFDPMQTLDVLFHLKAKYGHSLVRVGIETVAYQKALIYFLTEEMKKRQVYMDIVELKGERSKEERIRGLVPLYKSGVLFHRKGDLSLEEELMNFPAGKHDDRIDALAYMLQVVEVTRQSTRRPFIPQNMSLTNRNKKYGTIQSFGGA